MSAPLRFLGLALLSWVGLRAYSHSLDLSDTAAAMTGPAPLSSPIAALAPEFMPFSPPPAAAAIPAEPPPGRTVIVRLAEPDVGRSVTVRLAPPRPAPVALASLAQVAGPGWLQPPPPVEEWPLSRFAGPISRPRPQSTPAFVTPARAQPLDRLALTSWAIMRRTPGPASLGSSGMLGGSQAGARLTWAYNQALAVSLRLSGPVGQRPIGGEAALGVAWRPLQSVPVRLLLERRQRLGAGGGRSAFALLAEGGVYDRPLPLGLRLDGYAQGGVVGVRTRDLFAEGAATVTRPLPGRLDRFAVGAGVWGGIQPGLSRLDVGPRLSMTVGRSLRLHLDYRLNVAGNALPGSGPTLSVAGDF